MIATCPLTVLADDREKAPWTFAGLGDVSVIRKRLATGDYSLPLAEGRVALSRKSLADLYATLLCARRRQLFLDELRRMEPLRSLVLVEESPAAADPPPGFTRLQRMSALAWLGYCQSQRDVRWYFADGRRDAEVRAFAWLLTAREELERIP